MEQKDVSLPISVLREGPIIRDHFTPEQDKKLHAIWSIIGPYWDEPYEKFELGFCRDWHPDREISVWARISLGLRKFLSKRFGDGPIPHADGRSALLSLCSISLLTADGIIDLAKRADERMLTLLGCWHNPR